MTTLLQQVIDESLKDFIPGMSNIPFLKMIKQGLRPGSRSLVDPEFKSEANSIAGTNFVASVGPQFEDLNDLFYDTAFNAKKPIKQIVAICDPEMLCRTKVPTNLYDCFDYFYEPREVDTAPFAFEIERTNEQFSEEKKQTGVIQSTLTITLQGEDKEESRKEKLNVTFFAVKDGSGRLPLKEERQKQILWDIFQYSLNNPVFVHCRIGLGRTGAFILTLEILKNFDTLFASDNPTKIAKGIIEILQTIRTTRPALVLEREQLTAAIEQASILHDFALEKAYIPKTPAPPTPAAPAPPPSHKKRAEEVIEKPKDKPEDNNNNKKFKGNTK